MDVTSDFFFLRCIFQGGDSNWKFWQCAAIDLVDEAAAKLKMEITSKPTALDEIDRAVLKLEMERLSLKNDTDKASRDRLDRLVSELEFLKTRQKELTEQWEHEKSVMTRIQSIKEEVGTTEYYFCMSLTCVLSSFISWSLLREYDL